MTVRVRYPCTVTGASLPKGATESRPLDGFMVKTPQHEAVIRKLAPPSHPWAAGASPAATAAAEPPLEPPEVFDRSQGFRHAPQRWLSVTAIEPNSGRLVLPK